MRGRLLDRTTGDARGHIPVPGEWIPPALWQYAMKLLNTAPVDPPLAVFPVGAVVARFLRKLCFVRLGHQVSSPTAA
ncbi:MAG: hypothetical protein WBY44_30985 [Bryobacteraceae bacterium]